MAKFITISLVLVLLVVAFLNGAYSVDEGEGIGINKLGKDDPNLYKSEKFGTQTDCLLLYYKCLVFPPVCPIYIKLCAQKPPSPSTLP
jgi:hypothetical protein